MSNPPTEKKNHEESALYGGSVGLKVWQRNCRKILKKDDVSKIGCARCCKMLSLAAWPWILSAKASTAITAVFGISCLCFGVAGGFLGQRLWNLRCLDLGCILVSSFEHISERCQHFSDFILFVSFCFYCLSVRQKNMQYFCMLTASGMLVSNSAWPEHQIETHCRCLLAWNPASPSICSRLHHCRSCSW